MEIYQNHVGGRWVPSSGAAATIRSPIDGETVHEVRFCGEAEIEAALNAAHDAMPAARALSQARQADALRALASALKARAPAIAETIVRENGTPSKSALASQAMTAVSLLEAYANLAADHSFETRREGLRGGTVILQKIPVGVSVGIAPWNVPVFLNCVKVAGVSYLESHAIISPQKLQ
jgi:betaine-aldehyde dehydrogenase